MSCHDVAGRIDAFIDSELSPSEQVEVARHVAGCSSCNTTVDSLLGLRDVLIGSSEAATDAMKLAAVWPAVEGAMDAHDARRWWWQRGTRGVPLWAAGMAMAAGALLVLRAVQPSEPSLTTLAHATSRNPVVIERLAGRDISVRREMESGTTLIWVNHTEEVGSR
jgi:anti-sigma factor RsiW